MNPFEHPINRKGSQDLERLLVGWHFYTVLRKRILCLTVFGSELPCLFCFGWATSTLLVFPWIPFLEFPPMHNLCHDQAYLVMHLRVTQRWTCHCSRLVGGHGSSCLPASVLFPGLAVARAAFSRIACSTHFFIHCAKEYLPGWESSTSQDQRTASQVLNATQNIARIGSHRISSA